MELEAGNTEVDDEDNELEGMDNTENGSAKLGFEDVDCEDAHEYDPATIEKLLGLTLPPLRSDMLVAASPASSLLTRISAILGSDPSAQIASPSWEPLSDDEREQEG